jgi:hypothetical protein
MMKWLIASAGFALLAAAAHQDVALKDLMPKGMVIGVAINQRQFDGADTAAVEIITQQFNQISPENVLKFQPTQSAADRYTFDAADRYVQFGVDRHMQVVGHNLVWHSQTGAWVFQDAAGKPADRDTLLARMRDHVRTVVGRYKGRIHGWDVARVPTLRSPPGGSAATPSTSLSPGRASPPQGTCPPRADVGLQAAHLSRRGSPDRTADPVENYRRDLDMTTATAHVSFTRA